MAAERNRPLINQDRKPYQKNLGKEERYGVRKQTNNPEIVFDSQQLQGSWRNKANGNRSKPMDVDDYPEPRKNRKWNGWRPNRNVHEKEFPNENKTKNKKKRKTHEVNRKAAREIMKNITISTNMRDLENLKGKEVIREIKNRLKTEKKQVKYIKGREKKKPTIPVEIGESRLEVLLDTRAEASIMTRDIFEQLGLDWMRTNVKIKGITKEQARSIGKSRGVPIKVFGEVIPEDIEIIEGKNMFLLELDWIKKAEVSVDPMNDETIFHWEQKIKVPFKVDNNEETEDDDTEEEDDWLCDKCNKE